MTEEKLKKITIGSTDIFLDDGEKIGQGKLTVSDTWRGAYSAWWGAMGGDLTDFICRINKWYFTDNLLRPRDSQVFDSKGTVRNIRKYIREELSYELPWWKYMSAQKELRSELKELELCESQEEFVQCCNGFMDKIHCIDLEYDDEMEFRSIIRGVFETEPWNFIETKPSAEHVWLCELHGKLVKKLKS